MEEGVHEGKDPKLHGSMRFLADNLPHQGQKPLSELLQEACDADPWPIQVVQVLRDKVQQHHKISVSEYTENEGRLHYHGNLYVLNSPPSSCVYYSSTMRLR